MQLNYSHPPNGKKRQAELSYFDKIPQIMQPQNSVLNEEVSYWLAALLSPRVTSTLSISSVIVYKMCNWLIGGCIIKFYEQPIMQNSGISF